jgi:hypothetical protein
LCGFGRGYESTGSIDEEGAIGMGAFQRALAVQLEQRGSVVVEAFISAGLGQMQG